MSNSVFLENNPIFEGNYNCTAYMSFYIYEVVYFLQVYISGYRCPFIQFILDITYFNALRGL